MSERLFLVDARHLKPAGDDGASRLLVGLLGPLPSLLGSTERLAVLARPDTRERLETLLGHSGATVIACPIASASWRQHVALVPWFRALMPTLYHYPQYDLPLVPVGVATSIFIHDVTPLEVPGYFGRGRSLRAFASALLHGSALARADVVVVNSEATASAVRDLLPEASRERVHVAMPGPSPAARLSRPPPESLPGPRFVYVGNHRPHKRVRLLLEAFSRVRREIPGAELILIGRPDLRFPEVPELLAGTLGRGVELRTDVGDAELLALLSSARALCFPSIGEGFGFPVLEAYAAGIPAIVANAGALPEVAGDAALVVDPAESVHAWCNALLAIAKDDVLWRRLASRAPASLERFSWTRHAEATVHAWRWALARRASRSPRIA